jgi:hypothetical protein
VKLRDAGRDLGLADEELRLLIRSGRLRLGPSTGGAPSVSDRSVDEVRVFLADSTDSLAVYLRRRARVSR